MWQISLPRIQRYAIILGIAGAVATLLAFSYLEAIGFLVGAGISLVTIQSWGRFAESLAAKAAASAGTEAPRVDRKPGSPTGAAIFMALRYILIGGALYVSIKVLGVTPVAMLAGLLVSFLAVLIEICQQMLGSR